MFFNYFGLEFNEFKSEYIMIPFTLYDKLYFIGTGVVTGEGTVPTTPMPGCFYEGKFYADGQRWQDGCDYNCECIDGMNGKYQCSQRSDSC